MPANSTSTSSSRPQTPSSTKAPHRTRHTTITPQQREPVTTWRAFNDAHKDNAKTLGRYLDAPRKNSVQLPRSILSQLSPGAATFLYANNITARLRFADIATRHIAAMIEAADGTLFFWITLIPRQFVVPEDRAADFQPKRIQNWTHEVMRGLSYVGMVEAALYTNLRPSLATAQRAVSWHVHLIAWGRSEAQIRALEKRLNKRFEAVLPGVDVARCDLVPKHEVVGKALYMLKAPQSEYRVYPRKVEEVDPETGEVFKRSTGRFRQKKRALRPCDMVRMCKVLADKHLDQLAFAAGEGTAVLAAIRTEALRPLRQQEAREAARHHAHYPSRHPGVGPSRPRP